MTDNTNSIEVIACPLCGYNAEHREHNGTHAYVCEECPFIGFEYYRDSDYENLRNIIKD